MNPYAAHLGGREPLEVIASTPQRLAELLTSIGSDRAVVSSGAGRWSPRDILCHLADTELTFAFRLRQTLAEDHHVIQPFDQDGWARTYNAYDAPAAVALFTAVRQWNVTLIRSLDPAVFSKPVMHPERGQMTFQTIVETMGGHDLNHVRQLEAYLT